VIICGRNEATLAAARRTLPSVEIARCDLTNRHDREALVQRTLERFPNLNMVVNNAGILRTIDVTSASFDFAGIEQELVTDLYAPVDLTLRFLPHLRQQPAAALVNVSSGLVYSPAALAPVYAAAKAGLHAFTETVRYQLRGTAVRVVEVLPPTVDTALNAAVHVPKISPDAAADAIITGMVRNTDEIRIGQVKALYVATRIAPRFVNRKLNELIAASQQPSLKANRSRGR
jgi:uncharacterized oxidoreductase